MMMLVYRFTKFHCKILDMMHRMGKFTPTHTHAQTYTHIRIARNNSFRGHMVVRI